MLEDRTMGIAIAVAEGAPHDITLGIVLLCRDTGGKLATAPVDYLDLDSGVLLIEQPDQIVQVVFRHGRIEDQILFQPIAALRGGRLLRPVCEYHRGTQQTHYSNTQCTFHRKPPFGLFETYSAISSDLLAFR